MMTSTEVNIDITNFEPSRPAKRKNEEPMEIEFHNGIQGTVKDKSSAKRQKSKDNLRKVAVPAHRYTPLKENWLKIFTPIVEHLKLQVRFNLKSRNVEIKTSEDTDDLNNLQKAADFVKVSFFLK